MKRDYGGLVVERRHHPGTSLPYKLVLPNRYSWITWKNCLKTLALRFIVATGLGKMDSET